jgi:hypothetical protein
LDLRLTARQRDVASAMINLISSVRRYRIAGEIYAMPHMDDGLKFFGPGENAGRAPILLRIVADVTRAFDVRWRSRKPRHTSTARRSGGRQSRKIESVRSATKFSQSRLRRSSRAKCCAQHIEYLPHGRLLTGGCTTLVRTISMGRRQRTPRRLLPFGNGSPPQFAAAIGTARWASTSVSITSNPAPSGEPSSG